MRVWLVIGSMVLALALAVGVVAAAPPPAVGIEVEAGFDGYYKVGEWIPIAVTLSNTGQDVDGKAWLEVPDETGDKTTYAKLVSLPSRSKKRVYLYAYSTGFLRDAEINFQVANEVVASSKAALRPLQPNESLLGVVGGGPSTGSFLSGQKMPSTQAQGDGRSTVAHISLSQIPPRMPALRSLDALIFSDVSTAELEVEQRQAIEGWVSSGGTLMVAGGANGAKTAAGLRDLLPFKVTGLRSLDAVKGLEELAGAQLKGSGPFLASVASEVSDAVVLAQQDGVPLVIERELGQGKIVFLALDVSVPPLNSWLEDGLFWRRILASNSAGAPSNGLNKRTGVAANMQSALSNIPAMDLPSVTALAVFLLVYILAVGPANYLALRRFDRREWAWITVPVLTLAFTGGAYAIGFGAKGGEVIVHEITVLRSGYGSSTAEAESYIGVFSPARRTYQLEVGGDLLLSKPRSFGSSGFGSSVEVLQGSSGQIKDVNVNAWSMQPFMAEGSLSLPGAGIQSALRVEGDRIKGKITNATGAAVEDGVLMRGRKVARIGTLKPGETRELDVGFEVSELLWAMSLGSLVVGELQPAMGPGGDRDKSRKRMVVDAAFGYYGKQPSPWPDGGLTLLGWQAKSPLEVDLKGEWVVRQSTVLLIASLPVLFGDRTVSVPVGFARKSIVGMTATKVGASPFGLSLGDGSITIRYQLPAEVAGIQVKELFLQVDQPPGMMRPPGAAGGAQPNLRLFNWKRGQWVDLGKVSGGMTSIAQAADFVSSGGAIEARLEAPGGMFEVGQIDFSVNGQR